MRLFHIYKKLRYPSNPTTCATTCLCSLSSSSSVSLHLQSPKPQTPPAITSFLPGFSCFKQKPTSYFPSIPSFSSGLLRFHTFLTDTGNDNDDNLLKELDLESVVKVKNYASPNQISAILDLIRKDESGLEDELDSMNVCLSNRSVADIYNVLNSERALGLRFFNWIWRNQDSSNIECTLDICSSVINHCGWLDDYKSMLRLLKEFNLRNACLKKRAFGFLDASNMSEGEVKELIVKLLGLLKEVDGSSRSTGVRALIERLGNLGMFDMARFVIDITERTTSHYNILVREHCWRCEFQAVKKLFDEMRQLGCDPDVKSYNYLLSWLCKNDRSEEASNVLKEMREKDCPPDAISFEIFISYSFKIGKVNVAKEFLNQMISSGIEPRLLTHAIFVKGLFYSGNFEEAYTCVVGSETKFRESYMIYSLLSILHLKKGQLFTSRKILIEMMDRGMKPYVPVYWKVVKRLQKTGRAHWTIHLRNRFSRFRVQSSTQTS